VHDNGLVAFDESDAAHVGSKVVHLCHALSGRLGRFPAAQIKKEELVGAAKDEPEAAEGGQPANDPVG